MTSLRTAAGFTLVEMIVSLALFSVVMTISVGALLSLIGSNDQLRAEQAVMTNLAFALDSMSREIRTGTYYYCGNSVAALNNQESLKSTSTQDCDPTDSGIGLSFVEGGNSITGGVGAARISYYFDANKIWRRVRNEPAQSMTAEGIYIADTDVWVTDSGTLRGGSGDARLSQPTVTLFIEARATSTATGLPYYVQTTVTQRALDL